MKLTDTKSLGEIPSFKLVETEKTLAFLDINPLSRGHAVCFTSFVGRSLRGKRGN